MVPIMRSLAKTRNTADCRQQRQGWKKSRSLNKNQSRKNQTLLIQRVRCLKRQITCHRNATFEPKQSSDQLLGTEDQLEKIGHVIRKNEIAQVKVSSSSGPRCKVNTRRLHSAFATDLPPISEHLHFPQRLSGQSQNLKLSGLNLLWTFVCNAKGQTQENTLQELFPGNFHSSQVYDCLQREKTVGKKTWS